MDEPLSYLSLLLPLTSPPLFQYSYQDGYIPDHPPHYSGPGGYQTGSPQHQKIRGEPFTVLEIRLMRQVSGFGFRIIGGKEEGSQVSAWEDGMHNVVHITINGS